VSELLAARGIEVRASTRVREKGDGSLALAPAGEELDAAHVVALPQLVGPAIPGLPADENGFIPIDEHARVRGAEDVYAAADGTNFPVKQGGLRTQQADAAAEHIAARFGADLKPAPFHPVLRGMLITGGESISLEHPLTGGEGKGEASIDYLWWPPHKVSGRYLAPLVAGETVHSDPAPPGRTIDVEVALPKEWHSEPMALDRFAAPPLDD
jgi:sulfide:quinone oxidoreductase